MKWAYYLTAIPLGSYFLMMLVIALGFDYGDNKSGLDEYLAILGTWYVYEFFVYAGEARQKYFTKDPENDK